MKYAKAVHVLQITSPSFLYKYLFIIPWKVSDPGDNYVFCSVYECLAIINVSPFVWNIRKGNYLSACFPTDIRKHWQVRAKLWFCGEFNKMILF